MKQMTKQLIMAAFILGLVTVLSLGIRQVRLSVQRARNVAIAPAPAPASNAGDSGQRSVDMHGAGSEQDFYALDEQDHQGGDTDPFNAAGDSDQAVASADHSNAYEHSGERADIVSMDKSFKGDYSKFKGDYAKSKGSKGFQKISVGAYENIYITDKGEHWYVQKLPDGTTTKMQLQEIDGELQPVGKAEVYSPEDGKGKSEGGQGK